MATKTVEGKKPTETEKEPVTSGTQTTDASQGGREIIPATASQPAEEDED